MSCFPAVMMATNASTSRPGQETPILPRQPRLMAFLQTPQRIRPLRRRDAKIYSAMDVISLAADASLELKPGSG